MPEAIHRIPPNSIEAEQSVLGALLLSENCVLAAAEKLKEEDFYSREHRRIWRAMADLAALNKPVDLVTVSERMGEGEPLSTDEISYLSNLTEAVPSIRNIDHYIVIIREKSRLRKLISAAAEIAEMGYKSEAPAGEILNTASDLIYKIAEVNSDRS